MSAVSGASPDAAPSGAVRAVELAIRGDRTSCSATVEKKLIKLAEGLLAAAVLAGCGTPQAPVTPGAVKVAAAENFWGNISAQVGGRHARVTSILSSPAADPHLYYSDVASALAVAQARLVIANGAGYDEFMCQLLGATVNAGRVALSIQEVLGAYGPVQAVSAVTQQVRVLVLERREPAGMKAAVRGCGPGFQG